MAVLSCLLCICSFRSVNKSIRTDLDFEHLFSFRGIFDKFSEFLFACDFLLVYKYDLTHVPIACHIVVATHFAVIVRNDEVVNVGRLNLSPESLSKTSSPSGIDFKNVSIPSLRLISLSYSVCPHLE